MLATVGSYIDAKIGKKQFPELIKMAKELYGMGYTDEADLMIVDKIKTSVDPTIAAELVALKRKKDRKSTWRKWMIMPQSFGEKWGCK